MKRKWEHAKCNKTKIKIILPFVIILALFGLFCDNIKLFVLGITLLGIEEVSSALILQSCLLPIKDAMTELCFINGAIIFTFIKYIFDFNQTAKNYLAVCQFVFIVIGFYMLWYCKRKTDMRWAEIHWKEEKYYRKKYGDYWYAKHKMDQQIYGPYEVK